MSDYTPTTEEVRNAYGVQRYDQAFERGYKPEFDRWLAERDAKVWAKGFSDCLAFMSLDNPDFERASKYYDRVTK